MMVETQLAVSKTGRRIASALAGLIVLSSGLAVFPDVRWRMAVVLAKATGDLPTIPAGQLLRWLAPNSPVWLGDLGFEASPDAMITNRFQTEPEDAQRGATLYQAYCSQCHGADGAGGGAIGLSLVEFVATSTDWQFLSTVKWGRPGTAMAAQPLEDIQIWDVHAFLKRESRAWAAAVAEPVAGIKVSAPLERLLNPARYPEDWLQYSGSLEAHRHSALGQITKANVGSMRVAWVSQLRQATKPLSATPIVSNGVMFVSEAPDGVTALDASSGKVLWEYRRPVDPSKLPLCCGAFNRGVAILDDSIFVATLDSSVVALDAATGTKRWESQVADPADGYSMTGAPLVVEGHVIVGVAGGEFGMRGLLAALSPKDGKLLWQFDVVPGPGKPGNDTWAGDSWKTGGGPTWTTGAYDRALDLVLWTTGNPWPPLDATVRRGDNLYSNSIVALERTTGKLKWHYQFTPEDTHDWDATQQPVLTDVSWQGETVPVVIMANRNAFYYVIDRRNGKFLFAKPFVKQTWSKGFDNNGRPIRDPASLPSKQGTLVWPWMHGGTNWWPPSYDAARKLHFVPTVDAATQYFTVNMDYEPATMTMGGTTRLAENQPSIMAVKAIDPGTGTVKWTTRLDQGDFHAYARIAGLVSTDAGLVFAGYERQFFVLDSDTGSILWRFNPGGQTNAGAIVYAADGVQYFAALAGSTLFAFSLPQPLQGAEAAR